MFALIIPALVVAVSSLGAMARSIRVTGLTARHARGLF